MKMLLLAAGVMREASEKNLLENYTKRITRWPLTIEEEKSGQGDENWFLSRIPAHSYLILLDEKGDDISSMKQAKMITELEGMGEVKTLVWTIGGADGHKPAIRERADRVIRFGRQTWPHMLARIMLVEQLYRMQEIIRQSPYHREG